MIVIEIIKLFADEEIYAMHKIYYRSNDISVSSALYTSKETTQSVLSAILEVTEKNDVQVKVRWRKASKIFDTKGGVDI